QRLLDELEAEERLARAMRSLPAEEAAEEAAAQRPASAGFQRGWALAWAASIFLALTPAWLLYRSGASAEAERQRERARASEVAAEQAREIEALGVELRASEARAAEMRSTLESQGPESPPALLDLERRLEMATRPRANVATVRLEPLRSLDEDGSAAVRLTLAPEPEWVVLIFEPREVAPAAADGFGLEVLGPEGGSLWSAEGLKLDGYGQIVVQIYSPSFKEEGVHRLILRSRGVEAARPIVLRSALEIRR
ncbi:MAG: hypothetical protein AAF725_17935, partial [Acidobacteriota bacterium]